jgi:hypothetical protein
MTCFLAQFSDEPCDFYPTGVPDPAHLVKKSRLRDAGIDPEDRWDRRAVVPACRKHHASFDGPGGITLSLTDYPESFIDYATEHGLTWDPSRRQWRVFRQRETA